MILEGIRVALCGFRRIIPKIFRRRAVGKELDALLEKRMGNWRSRERKPRKNSAVAGGADGNRYSGGGGVGGGQHVAAAVEDPSGVNHHAG